MDDGPTKSEIQAIFKRLRSIPTNKQCFDCGSNNPTWASVTYGVFLCIDCSAVHRSLGVHVTFIRSTQLDTNWTWLQLRAMQVGGNANAIGFFRQHGCTTKDSQQKYHSRAATLYKDKLHALATHALRLHGNKLHIDTHQDPQSPEVKDIDFFAEHSDLAVSTNKDVTSMPVTENQKLTQPISIENGSLIKKEEESFGVGDGPNVEHALSMSPTEALAKAEPRKSIIGAKKVPTKKGKGGFGAQKVTTNFKEIENQAEKIDKEKEVIAANNAEREVKSREEQEKQMVSMRLAYQDMTIERKKQEEKLKVSDPKKAAQMERLGMGFTGSRGISHSAMTDMQTIEQEGLNENKFNADKYERHGSKGSFFEEEMDLQTGSFSSGPPKYDNPFGTSERSRKNEDSSWGSSGTTSWGNSSSSSWGMDRFDSKQDVSESITSKKEDSIQQLAEEDDSSDQGSTRTRKTVDSTPTSDDAQKKFGSAKAISSDQYFGNKNADCEAQHNLTKFEGSSSISSDDLFGTGDKSRKPSSSSYYGSGTDFQDIKEGMKQGVSKVAGRLSNIASGVMSSLQDKYGT